MHAFRRIIRFTLLIGALVCLPGVAGAQIPNAISYQGILTNAAVPPVVVPDGNYNLTFSLYTAALGGSAFWTEVHTGVPVAEGRFWVELGSVSTLTVVSFGAPYFLGITVGLGAELPRIPLTASAYSLNARRVATVDSAAGGVITTKVAIGPGHTNTGTNAFVAGSGNTVSGDASVVAGGTDNRAYGTASAVGGGMGNTVNGESATICGGDSNSVAASHVTVAGGSHNGVNGYYGVVGGGSQNIVQASWGVVPGGLHNRVAGRYSFAAGRRANAIHAGSFVWGDSTDEYLSSDANNQFKIRASGGMRLAPVASLECDAPPTTVAAARLIYIDQTTATTFNVYITNGSYAPTDNDFTFIVTAR